MDFCGNFVASGGSDDRIFIYDLRQRKEYYTLTHHNATVNCVGFTPGHTHLISGSADGVLSIVRVGNWQLEKLWEKAHKGAAVLDIAVHPSGKLALTLGADATLCTWNLVKGRQAYVINLNTKSKDAKGLNFVTWSPCSTRFALTGGKYSEIWSIEKGGILQSTEHSSKVCSSAWISNEFLLVGHENGEITRINTKNTETVSYKAHESRVKAIAVSEKFIVTAASSGEVKSWDTDFNQLHQWTTGCRITCLCLVPLLIEQTENQEEDNVKISDVSVEEADEEEETSDVVVADIVTSKPKRKKLKT